jgi:PIN domain nuclease of toxin-antitoxin system
VTCLLDASAVLAAILDEPGGDAAHDAMADGALSVVNQCEVLSRLTQGGIPIETALGLIQSFELRLLPLHPKYAVEAARLRPETKAYGLSLGDRVCLAHALLDGFPIVTADRNWAKLDLGLDIRLIR